MREKKSEGVVSTSFWLRGGGSPSVFDMASLMSEADRVIADLNEIAGGDSAIVPPKPWWKTLRDKLFWQARETMYVLFFLAIRWVIFIVVYTIWIFAVVMAISYLLLG